MNSIVHPNQPQPVMDQTLNLNRIICNYPVKPQPITFLKKIIYFVIRSKMDNYFALNYPYIGS